MNPLHLLRAALLRDISPADVRHNLDDIHPYIPGDDYRHIDWNATARTGELYSRIPYREKSLTLATIVDTSTSMHVGKHRSLLAAAEETRRMWSCIAGPEDRYIHISERDIPSAVAFANVKLPQGTALLVISDCHNFSPCMVGTSKRLACTLLLARDPWYNDFPLRGFHRVRDIETGASRRMFFGHQEGERYRRAAQNREKTILKNFTIAGWRTGILTEDNSPNALFFLVSSPA